MRRIPSKLRISFATMGRNVSVKDAQKLRPVSLEKTDRYLGLVFWSARRWGTLSDKAAHVENLAFRRYIES